MPPTAAALPADSPTSAIIAGPIAQLLEANFAILNEVRMRFQRGSSVVLGRCGVGASLGAARSACARTA